MKYSRVNSLERGMDCVAKLSTEQLSSNGARGTMSTSGILGKVARRFSVHYPQSTSSIDHLLRRVRVGSDASFRLSSGMIAGNSNEMKE
jgi:hypothetical protein